MSLLGSCGGVGSCFKAVSATFQRTGSDQWAQLAKPGHEAAIDRMVFPVFTWFTSGGSSGDDAPA